MTSWALRADAGLLGGASRLFVVDEDWDEDWDEEDGDLDDDLEDEEADEDEDWEEDPEEDDGDEEDDEGWDEDELAPPEVTRTLRFGLFAMAPLFLLYELSLRAGDGARAVSESLLTLPFAPLTGGQEDVARWALVGGALAVSAFFSWRHVEEAGRRVLRVAFEGALAAVFLLPLFQLVERTRVEVVAPASAAGERGAAEVGVALGGAAYDELLFRILLLSLAFVAVRGLLRATGMSDAPAGVLAAIGGAALAALAFAAAPLAPFADWVGVAGEAFHGGVFAWRVVAGLFLALLLVWRGVGVAAWAHALHHLLTHLRP